MLSRYLPQVAIPEIGPEGQSKIAAARVLLVGLGGLGSPAATYLAAAGVGRLGLMDFDRVEESNLQRQTLYTQHDLGRRKADVARERLHAINPNVELVAIPERLSWDNALELIGGYDAVVDGTDNFSARYLINDACAALGKANIFGSVYQFEGQVSVFCAPDAPCYRCLFPSPPERAIGCGEAGVIGALPGVVGAMQAAELLKLVTGAGRPLIGRMLHVNLAETTFRTLPVSKAPDCAVCDGKAGGLLGVDAYAPPACAGLEMISASELREWMSVGRRFELVDVRSEAERRSSNIGGVLIPLPELLRAVGAGDLPFDRSVEVVAYCQSGVRSGQAVRALRNAGYDRARSLEGGVGQWASGRQQPTS